jgi:hypothetical protein
MVCEFINRFWPNSIQSGMFAVGFAAKWTRLVLFKLNVNKLFWNRLLTSVRTLHSHP